MTSLAIALGVAGLAWGLIADRIGARWPAHDDGSVRPVDWRTPVPAIFGSLTLAILRERFDDPATIAFLAAYLAVLTLMLATDLDQRLLPDPLTLPLVPLVGLAIVLGADPFVRVDDSLIGAVIAALAFPGFLWLASIPFGSGAIGIGDLKLLLSVGLLLGLYRTFVGLVAGSVGAAVVILALMATRRIGRRTYIPFGPFLIFGTAWGLLGTSG